MQLSSSRLASVSVCLTTVTSGCNVSHPYSLLYASTLSIWIIFSAILSVTFLTAKVRTISETAVTQITERTTRIAENHGPSRLPHSLYRPASPRCLSASRRSVGVCLRSRRMTTQKFVCDPRPERRATSASGRSVKRSRSSASRNW